MHTRCHRVVRMFLVFGIAAVVADRAVGGSNDWVNSTSPIQIMPKSTNPGEFTAYAEVIPHPVLDSEDKMLTVYDFSWPLSAIKEDGQWLQIQDDGSVSRKPLKLWVRKDQLKQFDKALDHYNEQLTKGEASADDQRGYHWLIGIVLENQTPAQQAAAEYQYYLAYKGADDELAARARWGYARVKTSLFPGDPQDTNHCDYLQLVSDVFCPAESAAQGANKKVPSFSTDWGQALEKALPDPGTDGFVDGLAWLQLSGKNGSQSPYPDSIPSVNPTTKTPRIDPKTGQPVLDPKTGNPPTLPHFDGILCQLREILTHYDHAENHSSPAAGVGGASSISDEDINGWDVPHRYIGSLYANYHMKRGTNRKLYIDLYGDKAYDDTSFKSITADDEFGRAIRRNQDSEKSHFARAKLENGYRELAQDDAIDSLALAPGRIVWATKLVYDGAFHAAHNSIACGLLRRLVGDSTQDSTSDVDLKTARDEWANALAPSKRAVIDIQNVITRYGELETVPADLQIALNNASDAATELPPRTNQTDQEFDNEVQKFADNVTKKFSALRQALKNFHPKTSSVFLARRLAMLTDSKKSLVNVTAIWEYALNEAVTANDDSVYRNDEKLDLLATILFEQEAISIDPSKDDNKLDHSDPTLLVDRLLVDDATRYEKLAAEYGDRSKLQTYLANLNDWTTATHDALVPGLQIATLQARPPLSYAKSKSMRSAKAGIPIANLQPLVAPGPNFQETRQHPRPARQPWNIQDLHSFGRR